MKCWEQDPSIISSASSFLPTMLRKGRVSLFLLRNRVKVVKGILKVTCLGRSIIPIDQIRSDHVFAHSRWCETTFCIIFQSPRLTSYSNKREEMSLNIKYFSKHRCTKFLPLILIGFGILYSLGSVIYTPLRVRNTSPL